LKGKDLLSIADLNSEDISLLISCAIELEAEGWSHSLSEKVLALVFEKPSLRTRVSFEVAMRQLERAVFKLRQLAEYFTRRFMGDSSLSIFAIIDSLFNIDNHKLWDWARACDMSQRIFNSWCGSFINRMESDMGVTKLADYLSTYLNELWQITSHYYEYVEQFYEIVAKVEVPPETLEQYHKFVTEYNAFVQDLREHITELKSIARTGIEPPSVKLAQEVR